MPTLHVRSVSEELEQEIQKLAAVPNRPLSAQIEFFSDAVIR
jgi:hypothetical protein